MRFLFSILVTVTIVLVLFVGLILSKWILKDVEALEVSSKVVDVVDELPPVPFIGSKQEHFLKEFVSTILTKSSSIRKEKLSLEPNEGYFNHTWVEDYLTNKYKEVSDVRKINFYLKELPPNHKIKLEFSERNQKGDYISIVEERWINTAENIHVEVPSDFGKLYVFKLELYDQQQQMKDLLLIPYYTTSETFNAGLSIDKSEYKQNETLKLSLENWGPNHLFHGVDYQLQRKAGDHWVRPSEFSGEFSMEGKITAPYETYTQRVSLDGLQPGIYRINKPITIGSNYDKVYWLTSTFSIIGVYD
ncbi:immunoglobulin-like domain-containing protein [Bacillus litorisediminis]|uniref:immunoglobulin-like domain-containing protein n=1 Tax=Bacillus litorisediminis TaxID=2922713 RepID=UPI001FAD209C|nr:immunoglobulin-like domain-containing protein [Bacillus litorisediminis]